MPEPIERSGIGPPEPPERSEPVSAGEGVGGSEGVGPTGHVEGVAASSPIGQEVERVLSRAALAGVGDREACEVLVQHLIEGWISSNRRDEVARHVTDIVVDDPVFSQLLSRVRKSCRPTGPDD